MKLFYKYIFLLLFFNCLILETILSYFKLSANTIPKSIVNKNYLSTPYAHGDFVKGGLGEIRTNYFINEQGWNSIINYNDIKDEKIKIAIIGNSFIEGFHQPVEMSIGRIIEKQTNNKVIVHEYGASSANIQDFILINNDLLKKNYNYIFIYLMDIDLENNSSYIMNSNILIPKETFPRLIYNKLNILRYLNINRSISLSNSEIYQQYFKEEKKNYNYNKIFFNQYFNKKNIFIFDSLYLSKKYLKNITNEKFNIIITNTPSDFGFDKHWNNNGRINFSNTILTYLNNQKIF